MSAPEWGVLLKLDDARMMLYVHGAITDNENEKAKRRIERMANKRRREDRRAEQEGHECPHYWEPLDGDPEPKGDTVDVKCQICSERQRMTIAEYWEIPAGLPPEDDA